METVRNFKWKGDRPNNESASTSETPVNLYQTTVGCNNPDDSDLLGFQNYRDDNR